MAWTDEQKQEVISKYQEANPTPDTSTEIIKQIAEEMNQSPNGVRMILIQANVYVKKEAAAASGTAKAGAKTSDKAPRVSKEASITALKEAIKAKGQDVDDEILDKLTGKAAVYFTAVIKG